MIRLLVVAAVFLVAFGGAEAAKQDLADAVNQAQFASGPQRASSQPY